MGRSKRAALVALCAAVLALAPRARGEEGAAEYLTGGPLAGVKLPRFPTQHGEKPGYPGCIPERMRGGGQVEDMGQEYVEWGPQGQAPEMHLAPGSVEHWRAYMFKYMPIRSFFDRQSQVRRFVAPDLPGAGPAHAASYAEPVWWVPRHAAPRPTGRHRKPVPVVRMKAGEPVLRLDLNELPVGLYVVRLVGAVAPEQCRPFREPLFVRMSVNDRPDGGRSAYRVRVGYCEQFYSVAELAFHAPQRRRYQAEVAVDRGSTVDLLVHTVSVDDALAGTLRRALKTRTTIGPPLEVPMPAGLDQAERLARDAAIWRAFPPPNAQGSGIRVGHGGYGAIRGVAAGTPDLLGEQIHERHGAWVPWGRATRDMELPQGVGPAEVFLANPKLGLLYTVDDLHASRPLPDPYPFKDDGAGLYFPHPEEPAKGRVWTPIGAAVHQARRATYRAIGQALERCRKSGDYQDAHDAAIRLCRWACAFPRLDFAEYLSNAVHEAGPFGRDFSCRRRATAANFLPHYPLYVKPILFHYDQLFEFIRHNPLLARSVGRFVPWVKSPEDVIELIDVYLVQTTAKRILRYHYHTDPMDIANLAAVVGDTEVTDPWMEWLFSRTFIYPLPVAGIQDTMISGTTREGTEFVGSTYYAQGEGALRIAQALDRYHAAGGNPRFDLSDPARYPKPTAHAWWRIENVVGGWDFLRVGDVCGPDKPPGHTLRDLGFARAGWRWTRHPKFAFILKHYLGRGELEDEEWAAIEAAAARCPRAPWLGNRSRVLPMWAAVLESGLDHDDPRFRRAATLRVGYGMGHHHNDTLDLQVVAHGLPMTVDGGQRPGYSVPPDRMSRIHNVVEVDGRSHRDHSWVTALADHRGARYAAATATPPPGATTFRRQVALIAAGEPRRPRRLSPAQQRPRAELPPAGIPPNAYVFDVFRVAGGSRHTYCFHGPLNDDFAWNVEGAAPPEPGSDAAHYLRVFKLKPQLSRVGTAPQILTATWRMAIEVPGPGAGEKEMLGKNYDPQAPRKFTRLHLLGVEGAEAMRGQFVCRRWNYDYTNLMVSRRADAGQPFAAVIEPYVGEPFLASVRLLPVEPAGQGVAVEVTTRLGRTDLCFADAERGPARTIAGHGVEVAAEFAYVATDDQGLSQATLVGGTRLATPHVRLVPRAARRAARVVKADYLARKLWLDQPWPARTTPAVLEVGLPGTDHKTTYTALRVAPAEGGSVVDLQRGADTYRSDIEEVRPDGLVRCTLKPMCDTVRGGREGWVASDDRRSRFWRADYLGGKTFKLTGGPVTREAFGQAGVLRLWECGAGDTAVQRTSASLRRVGEGRFALRADVALELSLPARTIEASADGDPWRTLDGRRAEGWTTVSIPAGQAIDAPLLLRLGH
ncbi:MAG: hypothetical protein ACLF0G_15100 [Candidatus Brocadiia bacterium]